jgi:hypothetical protein
MPSDRIIKRRITFNKIQQLESEFAEELNLNEVLTLYIDAATAQLTNGHIPHVVRTKPTPGFVFRTQPQYAQDQELLDFKLSLDVLKVKNKRLLEIATRTIKLLLRTLEPQLEDMIASLNISLPEGIEAEVAYRWNNPGGGTGYHSSIGFWCGQWKFEPDSDSKPRSFNDIEALKDHLGGIKIASPWISMTHIPGQMLVSKVGATPLGTKVLKFILLIWES